jgi:hypothetical protein
MAKRPRPDLDQVREAMRDHDERAEDPPPEAPPAPAEDDAGEDEDED